MNKGLIIGSSPCENKPIADPEKHRFEVSSWSTGRKFGVVLLSIATSPLLVAATLFVLNYLHVHLKVLSFQSSAISQTTLYGMAVCGGVSAILNTILILRTHTKDKGLKKNLVERFKESREKFMREKESAAYFSSIENGNCDYVMKGEKGKESNTFTYSRYTTSSEDEIFSK